MSKWMEHPWLPTARPPQIAAIPRNPVAMVAATVDAAAVVAVEVNEDADRRLPRAARLAQLRKVALPELRKVRPTRPGSLGRDALPGLELPSDQPSRGSLHRVGARGARVLARGARGLARGARVLARETAKSGMIVVVSREGAVRKAEIAR